MVVGARVLKYWVLGPFGYAAALQEFEAVNLCGPLAVSTGHRGLQVARLPCAWTAWRLRFGVSLPVLVPVLAGDESLNT